MIFLILSIVASTITVSFFKIFERVGVNILQAIIFNYITCAILGNLITNQTPVITTDFYNQPWFPYTLLLGFLFVSIFFAIGQTSQKMGVSVSMVSAKLSVVLPIIFALIFFGESLTILQIIGVGLSLLAVYFISKKNNHGNHQTKNIWVLPAIVFIGSGIIDTTLNFIQKQFIPAVSEAYVITTVFTFAFIFGSLYLTYLVLFKNEKLAFKNVYWGIFLGVPNYFSMLFLVKTLSYYPAASTTIFPINNIGIVAVSTLVSIVFFKEKLNTKNIIGLTLSIIAIAFIAIQF
jgi:drug/metabolite transporter (DMT)-like permease